MDLDFITAPVIVEFGSAEYDNTIGEGIMNRLEEYDEVGTGETSYDGWSIYRVIDNRIFRF